MDDLTQSLTSVWTNPAAGWSLMKAKLWEVQTEMQRRSGARSLELHQKCRRCLRHVRTTRAPPTAQRRHCGARGGEEVAATSDSLIAHHSYSLLLLNSISRRPTRSNRCLRGGGWRRHSLQQLLSRGAWRREEAPEVSRRRLQAAPGWRPSKHNPRPERRSPRQRATRRAPKLVD